VAAGQVGAPSPAGGGGWPQAGWGPPPRLCKASRLAPTLALPRCARTGLAGEGLRLPQESSQLASLT